MRESRGGLRYVGNRAIGVLKIHLLLVRPELVDEHIDQSRGILAHETTLEIVVPRVHWRRVEPGLHFDIARRLDGVSGLLAEALQRLEHLGTVLGLPGVDNEEL